MLHAEIPAGNRPPLECDLLADSYRVVTDVADPLRASVTLNLAAPLRKPTVLGSRSTGGVKPTVDEAVFTRPQSARIQRHGNRWEAPAGCSQLSWSIRFKPVGDGSYDLSKQESFFHPKGWWFLNESGSLLRYASQQRASVCAEPGSQQSCTTLPQLNQAPMFMFFGHPDRVYARDSWTATVYTGYDAKLLGLNELIGAFGSALDALAQMLKSVQQKDDGVQQLQFAWLGINSEHQSVGGAAGSDAFLANFMIENNAVTDMERTRLLVVSGHEFVHMLGVSAGAGWATESLASYYGYKAVASAPFSEQVLEQMTYSNQPEAPLHARGAAMWRDLDVSIRSATYERQSLDDFLPLLMRSFPTETELPSEFARSVAEVIGESKFDQVVGAYL